VSSRLTILFIFIDTKLNVLNSSEHQVSTLESTHRSRFFDLYQSYNMNIYIFSFERFSSSKLLKSSQSRIMMVNAGPFIIFAFLLFVIQVHFWFLNHIIFVLFSYILRDFSNWERLVFDLNDDLGVISVDCICGVLWLRNT
jgi:hypothetical protein